ncbi:hypothetical protein GTO27_11025 [Candidatus Bathyarchaeota archaeon]|nr:hypothetical protein [Candidatus Bathyarchaeota archaeon]
MKTTKSSNRKLVYSVVLVTIVLLAVLIGYYMFFQSRTEDWTAAIIDQLATEAALINQSIAFNITATSILNASRFEVKYHPSTDITVDFYKDLPSKSGKIALLRVHGAVRNESDFVDLFTSEPYDEGKALQHYVPVYGSQISHAEFLTPPYNEYFAIGPTFVGSSMQGRFDSNCVIILMGCNTLNETTMAEALVSRGAKVVIGWTNWVELSDTDSSTISLLRYLLAKDPYTVRGAIQRINQLDHPPFGATLDYYPHTEEAGDYVVLTRKNETSSGFVRGFFQIVFMATLAKWKRSRVVNLLN